MDWGVLCREVHPGVVPKAKLELAEQVQKQQGEAAGKTLRQKENTAFYECLIWWQRLTLTSLCKVGPSPQAFPCPIPSICFVQTVGHKF